MRQHRRPAEELNKELASYLGHDELRFDVEQNGCLRNKFVEKGPQSVQELEHQMFRTSLDEAIAHLSKRRGAWPQAVSAFIEFAATTIKDLGLMRAEPRRSRVPAS